MNLHIIKAVLERLIILFSGILLGIMINSIATTFDRNNEMDAKIKSLQATIQELNIRINYQLEELKEIENKN